MRKLASIQRVWNIEPIEGADRIELASVEGWKCVVNKAQFQKGDLGIYFEIDSFLPMDDRFAFLASNSYKNSEIMGEGYLLRTRQFRGQISQGLLMPIKDFHEVEKPELGLDLTAVLGVRKWETVERATTGGTTIGKLPYDVPHTDEIRVQNFPEYAEAFKDLDYYISTKMDGSSHSLSMDENGFHVCGHNYEYKDDGNCSFYEFVKEKKYEDQMRVFMYYNRIETLTVQGEFCAPGIQKNPLRLTKPEWYVFTVRVNGKRLGLNEMLDACKHMNMPTVPIEETGHDLPAKYPTVESLLARAEGKYSTGGRKEGIVIRPVEPIYNETIGSSLSMKVVSNKYLLKQE